jgi:hypothetical protein
MGYSVAVCPRTPALKEAMLRFGKQHFKRWSQLTGREHDYASALKEGGELSYDRNRRHIGFDYKVSLDREWAFSLCRWMAIRVGTKKKGVPQIRYDGCEWEAVEPTRYDEHGCPRWESLSERERRLFELEFDEKALGYAPFKIIAAELTRLSALWLESTRR